MSEQDCLYTLVTKHPDGSLEPRVIGSITEYLFAPSTPTQSATPARRRCVSTGAVPRWHVVPPAGCAGSAARQPSNGESRSTA